MRRDEFPIVDKVVKVSINKVLDEVKAEITEEETECPSSDDYFVGMKHGLKYAREIIDSARQKVRTRNETDRQ